MFHIECFCDDKSLARILWALAEFGAYNVSNQPVRDNKPNGAAMKKRQHHSSEVPELWVAYVKQHKLRTVKAADVKNFITGLGYSIKSYSTILRNLRNLKLLQLAPSSNNSLADTTYRVVNRKLKSTPKTRPPKAASKTASKAKLEATS